MADEEPLQPHDDERAAPTLADLRAKTISVPVKLAILDGRVLNVVYRPMAFTGELLVEMQQLIDRFTADNEAEDAAMLQETMRGLCSCLTDFVESWDLLGDDGKAIDVTPDNLMKLPWLFINQVASGMTLEGRGNPTNAAASSGPPRAIRRAASRTGSTSSKRRK